MAVSRTTRSLIERGDFDALEDEWLARAAEDEIDLDYFVGAARALAGQGEEARARLLLELLDGQLAERGSWAERLALLRRAGTLLLDEAALHPAILDTLGRLHRESPSFGGLAEAVGLHRAVHDLDKTWEKADRVREPALGDAGIRFDEEQDADAAGRDIANAAAEVAKYRLLRQAQAVAEQPRQRAGLEHLFGVQTSC